MSIKVDPDILHGQPHIEGTQIGVADILDALLNIEPLKYAREQYPELVLTQCFEAVDYARQAMESVADPSVSTELGALRATVADDAEVIESYRNRAEKAERLLREIFTTLDTAITEDENGTMFIKSHRMMTGPEAVLIYVIRDYLAEVDR